MCREALDAHVGMIAWRMIQVLLRGLGFSLPLDALAKVIPLEITFLPTALAKPAEPQLSHCQYV